MLGWCRSEWFICAPFAAVTAYLGKRNESLAIQQSFADHYFLPPFYITTVRLLSTFVTRIFTVLGVTLLLNQRRLIPFPLLLLLLLAFICCYG